MNHAALAGTLTPPGPGTGGRFCRGREGLGGGAPWGLEAYYTEHFPDADVLETSKPSRVGDGFKLNIKLAITV